MKTDFIVKEELMRAFVVYIVSFLVIGGAIMALSLPVPLSLTFWLALIPAALHFMILVKYRRQKHLTDPTITNIIRCAFSADESKK
jgi:uncharacterized protein (DUF983 family)